MESIINFNIFKTIPLLLTAGISPWNFTVIHKLLLLIFQKLLIEYDKLIFFINSPATAFLPSYVLGFAAISLTDKFGHSFSLYSIKSSVPQESVLAPTLSLWTLKICLIQFIALSTFSARVWWKIKKHMAVKKLTVELRSEK